MEFALLMQALELQENHGVRDQLRGLVQQLKQLPRNVPAPMQLPGAAGNGRSGNGHQPEGPQALLARCRELAMQVQVRWRQQDLYTVPLAGHISCKLYMLCLAVNRELSEFF